MKVGILSLNRFNGQEQFAISSATIVLIQKGENFVLNFGIQTEKGPIKTFLDSEGSNVKPNLEFIVHLEKFSWDSLIGKEFTIPHGYDEDTDEYLTNFYYFQHQETDENIIKIIEKNEDSFRAIITATCIDVDFYDGSKPRTKIEIDAWFKRKSV